MYTFDKYLQLADKTYFNRLGKVTKIVGLTIESVGPNAKLNDLCRIIIDREQNLSTMARQAKTMCARCLLKAWKELVLAVS